MDYRNGTMLDIGMTLGRVLELSETTAERVASIESRQHWVVHQLTVMTERQSVMGERQSGMSQRLSHIEGKPTRDASMESRIKRWLTWLLPVLALLATGDMETAQRLLSLLK